MIFYHGSTRPRKVWDLSTLGQGNDQYGPGFYFTDNEVTARKYADGPDGTLHRCDVNVSNLCPNAGSPTRLRSQLAKLIKAAPNAKMHLENWGENPKDAFYEALEMITSSTSDPHDAIQQVWIDFYRHHEDVWAKQVKRIFKWSLALPDSSDTGGDQFAVVWDPSVITILNTARV